MRVPPGGIVAICLVLSGCAEDVCRGADTKYYNDAVKFHLDRSGVRYTVSGPVVCVSASKAAALRAAEAQVDATFHEVAYLLKDSCEERAYAEWASREKLRFDIRQTFDMHNQPSGRMFLLRSFTREELAANRNALAARAPRKASCTP